MKKLLVMFTVFLFVLLPTLAGCEQGPMPSRVISERLIDQIDFSSWERLSFRVSPDCKRIAYAATKGGKFFIVVDGQEDKTSYDNVSSPLFSPDSQRVAYTARDGDKVFVVVDGVESKRYDRVGHPVFSDDSQRLAYTAQDGYRWF